MKFAFIAKHRGIWPAGWLCGVLGVSRGGFYAWLTRPRSQRSRSDEELSAKVHASFLASDRTYGARRVPAIPATTVTPRTALIASSWCSVVRVSGHGSTVSYPMCRARSFSPHLAHCEKST